MAPIIKEANIDMITKLSLLKLFVCKVWLFSLFRSIPCKGFIGFNDISFEDETKFENKLKIFILLLDHKNIN